MRVELTPTTVSPGLRVNVIRIGELEVAGTPPTFFQRIELATVDTKGDETTRLQIAAAATCAPTVSLGRFLRFQISRVANPANAPLDAIGTCGGCVGFVRPTRWGWMDVAEE